jgi:hypothetical protein
MGETIAMLKTLSVVSVLFTVANLWGQDCTSCRLEPVGVATGQTIRLKVSARAPHSCDAQLGFLDEGGKPIGPTSHVTLQAGQSTVLDMPSSALIKAPGQRAEIQPQVVPDRDVAESACQADADVIEDKPSGGPREGVKVHGHWTIDVRNADGTLASHREFENSLLSTGAAILSDILARTLVIGPLSVQLGGTVCTGGCSLYEPTEPVSGPSAFLVLTVSAPTSGTNSGNLVLAGSFLAPQTGNVNAVYTSVDNCPSTVLPVNCTAAYSLNGLFTATNLSTAVSVTSGQLVQVTVVISFS